MRLGVYRNIVSLVVLLVGIQHPALACQFVDMSAAIAQAARDTENYLLVTAALAIPVLAFDVSQRKFSVPLLLMVPVLAFHPFWTFRPFYWANCQFNDVLVSQFLLTLAVLLLSFRALAELRQNKK